MISWRPGETEVEARVVDQDREVGAVAIHLREHALEDPPEGSEMPHDLDDPDHGQFADVAQQRRLLCEQVLAAETEGIETRQARPQVAQELAAVQVARGLAAGDQESWGTQGRKYKRGCPFRGTTVPWTDAVSCPQGEHG